MVRMLLAHHAKDFPNSLELSNGMLKEMTKISNRNWCTQNRDYFHVDKNMNQDMFERPLSFHIV